MPRGPKRTQNRSSACIGCSDGEGVNSPRLEQSDQESYNDSDSEKGSRQEGLVPIDSDPDNAEDIAYSPTCRAEQNEGSCEDEEILLHHTDTLKQHHDIRRNNSQDLWEIREIMTEMMLKFQESQKDLMQTMFSNANRNIENVLSSLKLLESSMQAISSYMIRDTKATSSDTIITSTQTSRLSNGAQQRVDTAANYVASSVDSANTQPLQKEYVASPLSHKTRECLMSDKIADKQVDNRQYTGSANMKTHDSSMVRHYGSNIVQAPFKTPGSDMDTISTHQTLQTVPAQTSLILEESVDRHYESRIPQDTSDSHKFGIDPLNRMPNPRSEPCTTQSSFINVEKGGQHCRSNISECAADTSMSTAQTSSCSKSLRADKIANQNTLIHESNMDRDYMPSVSQITSEMCRSDTELARRNQTLRADPVHAQCTQIRDGSVDQHYGSNSLKGSQSTRMDVTETTFCSQTVRPEHVVNQTTLISDRSRDRHYGSVDWNSRSNNIGSFTDTRMTSSETATCTRTLRPEYISDQDALIMDSSQGGHYGSNHARKQADMYELCKRVDAGRQVHSNDDIGAGDCCSYNRNREGHCGSDFSGGVQQKPMTDKSMYRPHEQDGSNVFIPRSSLNTFIHDESGKTVNDNHSSGKLKENKTTDEQRKQSTRWLGLPITTQPHKVTRQSATHEKPVKMPAFDGKDSWKVWYNRFKTIADLNEWDETTKLNELLPRLKGVAGEFVYGEIPQEIIGNFSKLIEELESRFRTVETHKTYEAQFSKRSQLCGETIEEYAALKRLYDKAHVSRNPESRREVLLRRFLNGLIDDQARFEVEYHKDPSNIDEAVSHVVNYMEAKKTPHTDEGCETGKDRKKTVRFESDSSETDESDSSDHRDELRLRLKKRKKSVRKVFTTKKKNLQKSKTVNSDEAVLSADESISNTANSLETQIEKIVEEKLKVLRDNMASNRDPVGMAVRNQSGKNRIQCFFCRNFGHIQRECPQLRQSQELKGQQPVRNFGALNGPRMPLLELPHEGSTSSPGGQFNDQRQRRNTVEDSISLN